MGLGYKNDVIDDMEGMILIEFMRREEGVVMSVIGAGVAK